MGHGPTTKKQSGQRFFFVLFFQSSAYFTVYRGGRMVLLQRKPYFPKDPEGVLHFPGGGGGRGSQLFPGGGAGCPNAIFYRNPYNL